VTDLAGNVSKIEIPFIVTTSVSSMKALVSRYKASGKLNRTHSVQLMNSLEHAEDQVNKKHYKQAVKHLNDFIKHLQNKVWENQTEENCKNILQADANYLIQLWKK
jgi:hypothetical protein